MHQTVDKPNYKEVLNIKKKKSQQLYQKSNLDILIDSILGVGGLIDS